jgi:hypothetical protein
VSEQNWIVERNIPLRAHEGTVVLFPDGKEVALKADAYHVFELDGVQLVSGGLTFTHDDPWPNLFTRVMRNGELTQWQI